LEEVIETFKNLLKEKARIEREIHEHWTSFYEQCEYLKMEEDNWLGEHVGTEFPACTHPDISYLNLSKTSERTKYKYFFCDMDKCPALGLHAV
jgi:hypothetical protein